MSDELSYVKDKSVFTSVSLKPEFTSYMFPCFSGCDSDVTQNDVRAYKTEKGVKYMIVYSCNKCQRKHCRTVKADWVQL